MVNSSEEKIKAMLEAKGLTVLNSGAPDFLCYRMNEKRQYENVIFVEVKSEHDRFRGNQLQYLNILQNLGLKVEIVRANNPDDIARVLGKA